MSDDALVAAVVAARQSGGIVDNVTPLDFSQGYALARRVWPLLGTGAGWKIGATNAAGQALLGIGAPIHGRIFASGVCESGTVIAVPGVRPAGAEPEILFRIGSDVAVGRDPVAAIDRVAIGLEIVRPSRDDAFALGPGFIVADNAAHVALVVGPDIDPALLDTPEAVTVRLLHNGIVTATGTAAAVLGDPRTALRWLATQVPLQAGDWIASGAIVGACPFAIGDTVVADFGSLGVVEARRTA